MKRDIEKVEKKRRILEGMRGLLPHDVFDNIDDNVRLDLTYTSNALEGNTMTPGETRIIVKEGRAIGGKSLKEHWEILDHQEALEFVYNFAAQLKESGSPIRAIDVRGIQNMVVKNSAPEYAGHYAQAGRAVLTSEGQQFYPAPTLIPGLMDDLLRDITSGEKPATEKAFEAHYRLAHIHPFSEGNGRTARLLMNLILLQNNYPPVAVRPKDRAEYLNTLENKDLDGFKQLLYRRLAGTQDLYLEAGRQALEIRGIQHDEEYDADQDFDDPEPSVGF